MITVDADTVSAIITAGNAADALERALLEGLPGGADPVRTVLDVPAGQLLVMPSRVTGVPTVKLVTVVHDTASGGARVKGVHLVFDPVTLAPVATMDAAALSLVRTAAVSLVALRRLAPTPGTRVLLIGAGRQARMHLEAIVAEWPVSWVGVVARRSERAERFATDVRSGHPDLAVEVVRVDSIDAVLDGCDIVVCATTATEPLFDGAALRPGACVVALGAHTVSTRELSSSLVSRSFVVVEDRDAAMRESGDVVIPMLEGLMSGDDLRADLGELVRGEVVAPEDRPRVFSSVGMAWEDAVVSATVLERLQLTPAEKEKDTS